MIYAQFFQPSATNKETLIEACGDRSVIILDGRNSKATHNDLARTEAVKRGYSAYQLMSGATFTRSAPIGQIINV